MKELYIDNNATTPILKEVADEMNKVSSEFWGNPSSSHKRGKMAKSIVEESREQIASLLKVYPSEITFTSGGTESNNLAIQGLAYAHLEKRHIISSTIEHSSVYNTLKFLDDFAGKDVDFIKPDTNGILEPSFIKKAIKDDTLFISIMYANNEIGTIQPIKEIGIITQKKGILFHTDAVQALGKIPINIRENNIDLLSASGHKINGPMGSGFLYHRRGIDLIPLFHGGGQEFNLRSGTENVPGIAGLAKAMEIKFNKMENEQSYLTELTNFFIKLIYKEIPLVQMNGNKSNRIPNTVNLRFPTYSGTKIISYLSAENIFASPSSACSSTSDKPSRILTEIGLLPDEAYSSIRFSFSSDVTKDDVVFIVKKIKNVLSKI